MLRSLLRLLAGAVAAALTAASCAPTSDTVHTATSTGTGTGGETSTGSTTTTDPSNACLLSNCNADAECAGCANGRTTCNTGTHRCVACGDGHACPSGLTCSSFGDCVPTGSSCPVDGQGTPTISCNSAADCVACDPLHQVCDAKNHHCVACTTDDSSACSATERCWADRCQSKCPSTCATDNDCSQCGTAGHYAHACHNGVCTECSDTYGCPSGKICGPAGVCVPKCGQDGQGSCYDDSDCEACQGANLQCHHAIGFEGKCGPVAAGCSDFGVSTVVLPDPWNQVTNLCSNDGDCTGSSVGVHLNVGGMLRELTGIDQIKDAELFYGMNVCAAIPITSTQSCGLCVPCRVDGDCQPIAIDGIAGQMFGPIGAVATAILLDQIFGQNDHKVHMYCETVAAGYGVCAPCPGVVNDCGSGGTTGPGCSHDHCSSGDALDASCDACTAQVCDNDGYCCTTAWDSQCVAEVATYCATSCP